MPRICAFYGIVIAMYDDHAPPHFHVIYNGHSGVVRIDPVRVIQGDVPVRAQSLIFEWTALHLAELRENWRRARDKRALVRIEPLV